MQLQKKNHEYAVDPSLLCVGPLKWTEGDDSEGVDVLMRPEIMRFDVVPVTCLSNTRKVKETFNERL